MGFFMFRVELPQRAVNHPQLLTETYHSQLGYWWEGVGYEITQHQAHTLREAMAEMQARLGEAMDHIIANPKILKKLYFTGDKKIDHAIRALIVASWGIAEDRSYAL